MEKSSIVLKSEAYIKENSWNFRRTQVFARLKTGCTFLNEYAHRIGKTESPLCTYCDMETPETLEHFMFECEHWETERLISDIHFDRNNYDKQVDFVISTTRKF